MVTILNTPLKRLGALLTIISICITVFVFAYWLFEISRYASDFDDFLVYFYRKGLKAGQLASLLFSVGIVLVSELPEKILSWIKTGSLSSQKARTWKGRVTYILVLILFCTVAYTSYCYIAYEAPKKMF